MVLIRPIPLGWPGLLAGNAEGPASVHVPLNDLGSATFLMN